MSPTAPGARVQRMPRAQRRAQLLDAALNVFVSKGYHSAAMEDIADEAGVSKPVLYQHFPGKLDLYLALLDTQCDHLEALVLEALESSNEHEERVYATVRAFFAFVADEGGAFRLIYESDLTNDPKVRHRLDALEAQLGDAIAQRIMQDTTLPQELAEMLGLAMSGAAQVMARTWLAHGDQFSQEVAAQAAGHLAWRGIGSFPVNRMGTDPAPETESGK
ncbi:TetR/AcrR family transcriptional regulator [Janibacter sp. DB-40]|uniref:TetR/AcrR family transcriptional regulator n=1 Tax=Janibacter sp. DB-40 TaxID=3028808 RepID=UPI002406756B|nr:TetR/AcrR family transcriptional regulator [Janibacter sp. DB-40]